MQDEEARETNLDREIWENHLRPFSQDQLEDLRARLRDVEPELRAEIRRSRESAGWSQSQLAAELDAIGVGLDPTAITRIESGKRSVRAKELWALAVVFRDELGGLMTISTYVMPPEERLKFERRRLEILEDGLRGRAAEIDEQRAIIAKLEREVKGSADG